MVEQSRLTTLWGERRDGLRLQLEESDGLTDAESILQGFVRRLFNDYRSSRSGDNQLHIAQVERCLLAATEFLFAPGEVKVFQEVTTPTNSWFTGNSEVREPAEPWWLSVVPLVVALVLALWLALSTTEPLGKVTAVILAITAAISQLALARHRYMRQRTPASLNDGQRSKPGIVYRTSIAVDSAAVIGAMQGLLVAAEYLLAFDTNHQRADNELPERIIDYIHDLAAANVISDHQYTQSLVAKTDELLFSFNIDVLKDFEGANQRHFDRVPSLDPAQSQPILVKPALVQGRQLLRRGEILMPRTAGEVKYG